LEKEENEQADVSSENTVENGITKVEADITITPKQVLDIVVIGS
jgi:hypothetical protein